MRAIVAVLGLTIVTAAALAQEPDRISIEVFGGSYVYDAEDRVYTVREDENREATVLWGDRSITANHITYRVDEEILEATGEVKLWDQGMILRGNYLYYDIGKNEAALHDVEQAELSKGTYFRGERMEYHQIPSPDAKDATNPEMVKEYILYNGAMTANDLPVPHWEIEYEKIVVMPDDEMRAYNMVLVAQRWHLFYLPYFRRSLGQNEIAYYFEISDDSNLGTILYNRLNIEYSKAYRFDLYGDYYTDAGIGKGAKFRFDVPGEYGPKGKIYGYHILQEAPDNDRIFDGEDRYVIAGDYNQKLPYNMRLSGRGHYLSDSEYQYDYRRTERVHELQPHDIERQSVSSISLSKYWDEQSLRITGASRLDNFYFTGLPFVEREPQVHFEQYPTRLFDTDLYASLQLDYGRYRRELGETFPLNKTTLYDRTIYVDEVDRYDANFLLEYPIYLPGRYTLMPWAGFRGTYYDDPSRTVDNPLTGGYDPTTFNFNSETRTMPQAGLELSTRRTYEFDPFLDRFEKMRLVFEPILDYGFYDPNTALEELTSGPNVRFPYVDPVDEFRYQMHHAGLIFHSRVQGKDAGGGIGEFMSFSTGLSFDYVPDNNLAYDNFEFFDDPANHSDYRFADWVEDFSIHPFTWLTFGNTLRYDIDDGRIRSALYYTNITPIEPLTLTLGYNTYRFPFALDSDEQQDATFGVFYQLSPKWQIYYSGRFDLDEGVSRQNDIGLLRDLYDFFAMIEIEHDSHPTLGDDVSINFRVGYWGIGHSRKSEEVMRSPASRYFR